ncbi:polysaccharide deacetylase family protein, partial [Azospirillum brasilense]|uniref:polysaccharide deacetylase family protein n=1 Tax=Azospirillum brasilense TaxID=192 RepID=UPI001FFFC1C5
PPVSWPPRGADPLALRGGEPARARATGAGLHNRSPARAPRCTWAGAGDDRDRDGADRQSLTWDEVRHLAAVTDYGAHTRTHPILLQCDDQRCAEEIALCKTELEEAIGLPCRHFAFPNGDFSDREVAIIRQAGYRTARTIDPGWNGPKADPLRLHAVPISDDASVDWLSVQVTGIPAWLRKRKGDGVTPTPTPTHGDPLPAA